MESRNTNMVCLDTDILIGLLRGDKAAISVVKKLESIKKPLKTTIIAAHELLRGASISSGPEENIPKVKRLLSGLDVLTLNEDACEEVSKIYTGLKASGRLISEFDILIAGIVLYNNETLVSRDEHFGLVRALGLKW
jgi:tRNA(fMet)-specific endonuclease VapC